MANFRIPDVAPVHAVVVTLAAMLGAAVLLWLFGVFSPPRLVSTLTALVS